MNIKTIAKYIDQPSVISKLHSKMPLCLTSVATGVWGYETFGKDNKHKNKFQQGLKNAITISSAATAAYVGAKGLKIKNKTIFEGLLTNPTTQEVLSKQSKIITEYLSKGVLKDNVLIKTLNKAKNRIFNLKETETILQRLPQDKISQEFLSEIFPEPENLNSKEIFKEIKRLSLIGLIPVAGGVAGGVAADIITGTNTKKSFSNKIKEGTYQYLANIFLCNVGAGAALFTSEKLVKASLIKPLSPVKKLGVIFSGIFLTGILGGSLIANYISKKCIDPILGQKCDKNKRIYSERKPEALDIALHADDIATAGVLSGFKWIEPALPVMYFISGYRAGIGYRNNLEKNSKKNIFDV